MRRKGKGKEKMEWRKGGKESMTEGRLIKKEERRKKRDEKKGAKDDG